MPTKKVNENKTTKTEQEKIEVTMPETDLKLLKELYSIQSYSGEEDKMRMFIKQKLDEMQVPYFEQDGNIFGLNYENKPLLCAHMDMVKTTWGKRNPEETFDNFEIDDKACIRLFTKKERLSYEASNYYSSWLAKSDVPTYPCKEQVSLGADDKNGIYVILAALKHQYLIAPNMQFNFAFFHSEEIGCVGSTKSMSDPSIGTFIEQNCPYAVVIDRRNAGDIIGWHNNYCVILDDRLEEFAKERNYNYKCAKGLSSDAGPVSQACEAVNISCGYYEPHTAQEYTNLNELWNTRCFVIDMLLYFKFKPVSKARLREYKKITKTSYEKTLESWKQEKEEAVTQKKEVAEKGKSGESLNPKQLKMQQLLTSTKDQNSTKESATSIESWKQFMELTGNYTDDKQKTFDDLRNNWWYNLYRDKSKEGKKQFDAVTKFITSDKNAEYRDDLIAYLSDYEYETNDNCLMTLPLVKTGIYFHDEVFTKITCPVCGEEHDILISDLDDNYPDWREDECLYKGVGLQNIKDCAVVGFCPNCTARLDLTRVIQHKIEQDTVDVHYHYGDWV